MIEDTSSDVAEEPGLIAIGLVTDVIPFSAKWENSGTGSPDML